VTPDSYDLIRQGKFEFYDDVERGHEIQDWLDKHKEVTNYVIIDDDNDMLDTQRSNFVRTANNMHHEDKVDIGYGLTKICSEMVIKILS
jgi:hypothetical protein